MGPCEGGRRDKTGWWRGFKSSLLGVGDRKEYVALNESDDKILLLMVMKGTNKFCFILIRLTCLRFQFEYFFSIFVLL